MATQGVNGYQLSTIPLEVIAQHSQLSKPDCIISNSHGGATKYLYDYISGLTGVTTGALDQFARSFWEISHQGSTWEFMQGSSDADAPYSGRSQVIRWEEEGGDLATYAESVRHLNHVAQNWRRGKPNWGRAGVAISKMGGLNAAIYSGDIYSENCCALVPSDPGDLPAVWCFCSSPEYYQEIRRINRSLLVQTKYLAKVPFNLACWKKIAAARYPNGLPEPQSNDPTQWLFHGHPAGMLEEGDAREPNAADVFQVAIARLLGYRWPAELDPEMRLDARAREWVRCSDDLLDLADRDGIVCLSPVRGEASTADRVREVLAKAFGDEWSAAKERELLIAAADKHKQKTPCSSLEQWLRDRFFEEHCKTFHHRPFIWHIWDGVKDGFHALVNYHRLAGATPGSGEARRTLNNLAYSYLGDWIDRQRADQEQGKDGADARLAAAVELQEQFGKILEGERPYDIFVRWKPLHEQPIGWEPDINDGVRLNIRPFMLAELRKGRKGAGVLRWKPNITWKKDRGKEPQKLRPRDQFPWFWGCDPEKKAEHRTDFAGAAKFDGQRWNDLHYTAGVKRAAREAQAEAEPEPVATKGAE